MKTTLIKALLCLIPGLSFAQINYEPLELTKKLLTEDTFENIAEYSTGDFQGHPNKKDLSDDVTLNFRTLFQDDETAVINVTLTNNEHKGVDTYIHFAKENIWKISAFRALAMTGIIEKILNDCEFMTETQIDSLIANGAFKSKEDYDYQMKNMRLTIALDDEIIQHFNDNKEKFESLKNELSNYIKLLPTKDLDSSFDINNIFETKLRELSLGKISLNDYELNCDDCLIFPIGGMLDNVVGYFYLEDKSKLPEMNPSRIIMIREIGNNWYMYKTT